ncbi:hypothetical protein [Leptospira santarosai]|nr:hypothetical protein [Leptospira santarosai]
MNLISGVEQANELAELLVSASAKQIMSAPNLLEEALIEHIVKFRRRFFCKRLRNVLIRILKPIRQGINIGFIAFMVHPLYYVLLSILRKNPVRLHVVG